MAIVVEEEKKEGTGFLSIIIWIVVIGVIGGAVYYLFFKKPELIGQITTSASFKNTQQLSEIKLKPEDVLNKLDNGGFRLYVNPIVPSNRNGRTNPFLGR